MASLELFVSEYVVPLRAASDVVGHDDVVMMASNVELLLSWNQQFLHALKKCLKKDLTRPFAQVEPSLFERGSGLTSLCSGAAAHGAHAAPAVHAVLRKLRARVGDVRALQKQQGADGVFGGATGKDGTRLSDVLVSSDWADDCLRHAPELDFVAHQSTHNRLI